MSRHLSPVLILVTMLTPLAAAPASADTATSLGDHAGEGSTAFTGLAQAPEANLFTGALGTAIPIEVPPGRRNMTPQLALRYTSSGGPGPFGHGWDLPIGRIERSTSNGVPRCSGPDTDDFVLVLPDGATELVREAPNSTFYRPRSELAWIRAERLQSANQWVVHDRSGLKYTFGTVDSARVSNASPPVFLAQLPDGTCQLTTQWGLTRIEDPNGNVIDIAWSKILNVLYPATIRWGANTQSGGPPHVYTVRFLPEFRPDRHQSSRNGVASRLLWRIAEIDVETDIPAPGTLVRRYSLQYADAPPGGLPSGYQSLLSAVAVTGRPTQHFAHTASATGHRADTQQIAKPAAAYGELRVANPSLEVSQSVLDMNGDGLLDLVRSDDPPASSWLVFFGFNNSSGFGFDPIGTAWQAPGNWTHLRNVVVSSGGCPSGWSCTRTDTFDITGDGIPDYVDASDANVWLVHAGRGVPVWGFAPGVAWLAPNRRYIRRTHQGDTYQDVVDVTGDGRPDLVVGGAPGQAAPHQWDVYVNTGAGFATTRLPSWPAPVPQLVDHVIGGVGQELLDFNGDGLPDIVRTGNSGLGGGVDERCSPSDFDHASCLEVFLNTGQGFADPQPLQPVPLSWTVQQTESDDTVVQDVFDVNGDGLPDWLYRRFSYQTQAYESQWRVLLNLGGVLEAPVFLPSSALPPPYTEAVATRIWNGVSGAFRRTVDGNTRTDLVDVNGDGFLDHLTAGGPSWTVRLHAALEKPNLLGLMENGLGGTNTIVYRPSTAYANTGGDAQPDLPFVVWVVDKMRQSDGLCVPPATADVFSPGPAPALNPCIDLGNELVTRFAYQDGRFDAVEREFRGFRRVVRTTVQGSADPPNQTATTFAQTTGLVGRILQVDTYAGTTTLVRSEQNSWSVRDTGPARQQLWLSQTATSTYDLNGGAAPHYVATLSDPPDGFGNVIHHYSMGLFGAARVDTYTTYATPSGGSQVYDRPAHVLISDASGVLQEQSFFYDGGANGMSAGAVSKGNLKRVRARLSPTNANGPETKLAYDAYGNLIQATDANGRVTTTAYDAVRLYPATVTNPLGHATVTTVDYRWGLPLSIRDPNGATTAFAYDDAGRRTCVARAPDTTANCSSTTTYTFATQPGQMSHVDVETRQDAPRPPLLTRHYFDALGRPRFSERFQVVDGAPMFVHTNRTSYDAGGRVRMLHHPYPATALVPTNGATTYDYHLNGSPFIDPLNRLHRTTNADGTFRRTEYAGALSATVDESGQRTEIEVDPHGRPTVQRVFAGPQLYATTTRAFDGAGRLLEVRLNGVRTQAFTYDSLGRKTQMIDQDSGTWRYGYDAVGNLIWQDDPKPDRHVQFCYDALDRPQRRCPIASDFQQYFSCTTSQQCGDPETVRYFYDDPATPNSIGRLTRVVDHSGFTEIDAYDARGRQQALTRVIAGDNGFGRAEFAYTYDTNDRVVTIRYPDGEVVMVDHDDAGQPIALRNGGNEFYVVDARYDIFGRPLLVAHVNGVRDVRTYGGAQARHRLQSLTVSRTTNTMLDLSYDQYTARGLLERITDRRNLLGEISNTMVNSYDALGRLTSSDSVHNPADRQFAYDTMGNLTRNGDRYLSYANPDRPHQVTRINVGSPNGPAQPIAHDANGNRMNKQAQAYAYDTSGRLSEVAAGDATVHFVYDYRGQMAAKIVDGNPPVVTRHYSDLVETTNGFMVKSYYLGALRVAARSSTYTAWEIAGLGAVPGASIELAAASMARPELVLVMAREARWMVLAVGLCLLGGIAVVPGRRRAVVGVRVRRGQALLLAIVCACGTFPWPIVVQPPAAHAGGYGTSSVRHFHADHLGSIQVITSSAGAIVEQIRYLPYGQVRGRWDGGGAALAAPATINRREFTGYEHEPLSGLLYAGARFYDPELGSFLTHDPSAQFASPYSYGGGDPMNWSDPTGADFISLIAAVAIGAAVSAAINTVIAAAQGLPLNAIGKAALSGAIAGAAGVGLGVVASAASMGAASLAGTLPASVTMAEAMTALSEVAVRSAFSTSFANAAGQIAGAAGAPEGVVIGVGAVVGLLASFTYDQVFLNPTEGFDGGSSAADYPTCSTTGDHTNLTNAAARSAGYSDGEAALILDANLDRDRGWSNLFNNENHFDYVAQGTYRSMAERAHDLRGLGVPFDHPELARAIGGATHHLQDQFALGHILPGTSAFRGPLGAPIRFIIHNVIGGEVAFRGASYEATRTFLQSVRNVPASI